MTQNPAEAAIAVDRSRAPWRCAKCPYKGAAATEYDPCFRFETCKGVAEEADIRDAGKDPAPDTVSVDPVQRAINAIVAERTVLYGPPSEAFKLIADLKQHVAACPDPVARHVLDMLCVKIARLVRNPHHTDSWGDIAGYAKAGLEVTRRGVTR